MVEKDRICSVEDCNGLVQATGFCQKHYKRFKKHGDVHKIGKGGVKRLPDSERRRCSVDGCSNFHLSSGLCSMHYQRKDRHGTTNANWTLQGSGLKFISEIPATDECVEWPYGMDGHGYGICHYEGKADKAHRVSYKIHVGQLTTEQCILHQCDNSKCVNYRHFKVGTRTDNSREKVERGRQSKGDFVAPKLTAEEAGEILRLKGVVTQSELATRFGVSKKTISAIHCRLIWKHVSVE